MLMAVAVEEQQQWYKNFRVTTMWSSPDPDAQAFAQLPQWSVLRQVEPQHDGRILVEFFGNDVSPQGIVWVDAVDIGSVDPPPSMPPAEPPWGEPELTETDWYTNHIETSLWSRADEQAIAFARVPAGSIFQKAASQVGGRLFVEFFGNQTSPAGAIWVDVTDLDAMAEPPQQPVTEPDWPAPGAGTFSPEQIVGVVGCPQANVEAEWPWLVEALKEQGIDSPLVEIGAIATVAVETGAFLPIREYGSRSYFDMYEYRADLGNIYQGDGFCFRGGGLIQLTGRANYRAYGQQLGIDLENNSELILQTDVSARVFALYFKLRGVADAAEARNWREVRRRVNGGYNGWDRFIAVVHALEAMLP